MFDPTRAAGLARLAAFAPEAGTAYQDGRNYDVQQPTVSQLSPWLRHRLIDEEDVLHHVLKQHDPRSAHAFVAEVFWRGYFKGWLEQHPSVWTTYKQDLAIARANAGATYQAAITASTGLDCFDHWCQQLRTTGYLHNHARMWFASIWIFTLRLPWQLGARFFLDHLVDGDPASNTLSWRWVAGLHTKGKHYLATADNIARFTKGRFHPKGQLVEDAPPLTENVEHALRPYVCAILTVPDRPHLHIITEEDCGAGRAVHRLAVATLGLVSPDSSAFAAAAVRHPTQARGGTLHLGHHWTQAIVQAASDAHVRDVVLPQMPIGPAADAMAQVHTHLSRKGLHLHIIQNRYDAMVWPHAQKGFFKLKKQIPKILQNLGQAHD